MEHVVMKHRRTTLERAEKFISTHHFTDVNLMGRLHPKTVAVTSLQHYPAIDRVTYKDAIKGDYSDVKVGQEFGPTWSTHWFRVRVDLPAEWVGSEARLRWNSNSEALVWVDGNPVQGLSTIGERLDFILTDCVQADQLSFCVYVEMACNGLFGAGDRGMINKPDMKKNFQLSKVEAAVFDRDVYNLIRDVELLYNIAKHLPEGSERGYQALYKVNEMVNACDVFKKETYQRAHEIAASFCRQRNGDSQHTVHAMGHAHMDSAWLWPYAETIRKCARSWSCTVRLMEKYPDFTFTCSQAQQLDWVKTHYPGLYNDIKKFVRKGQFLPVGGVWVEMDGNLPSGEAFVRQFLYGQRFFQEEFGKTCKEFWLPDTFGYSAQLPQVMRHCGATRFLTQKLSWSLINKFPHHTFLWEGIDGSEILTHFPPGDSHKLMASVEEHHTFWWEGIDGTRVLTHFPPGDNYCMEGKVEEVLKTVNNFQDKGRSDKTVFLFGYGDGGNGPTEDMLERLKRMEDVDGLPKVKMSSPDEYFAAVEREEVKNLCHWVGELYLELHNGTYTTHALVKKMNRKCEFLLRDVEFLYSVILAQEGTSDSYPATELNRLWKLLLLNQFHDVLPGSSIAMVYDDAHEYYRDIVSSCKQLTDSAVKLLESSGDQCQTEDVVWNTLGWERSEVVAIRDKSDRVEQHKGGTTQVDSSGNILCLVTAPSFGYKVLSPLDCPNPVSVKQEGGCFVLENGLLTARIDQCGRVVHMTVNGSDRNAVSDVYPANQFLMYDDIPLYWDAWDVMDYHLETRKPVDWVKTPAVIIDKGPLRASLEFSLKISDKSHLKQRIILDAGSPYLRCDTEIDWHESRKFLKVEFPTSVHTRQATYEIQWGHLQRPNHANTSWDWARFEVCGHKWADLSEYNFGLAVLNDCKYGYSAVDNVLRLSLLRSPKAPDDTADMGQHTFTYAIMPHIGGLQESGVIQQAYNLNCSLNVCRQTVPLSADRNTCTSFFTLESDQVILETVKKSEDHPRTLVLRLYEAYGGHVTTSLSSSLPIRGVARCSGLERREEGDGSAGVSLEDNWIRFTLKPFQILSLLVDV